MAKGTGLTGTTKVVMSLANVNTIDLNALLDTLQIETGVDWTYGTGINQANLLFHDSRSIDDTGETLDLYTNAIAIKDAFGNAVTMEAIKLLYLKNTHATLVLEVFGNTSLDLLIMESTADAVLIQPGGFFLWVAPTAAGIVTTTNEKLFIAAASTGTVTYDIVAMGLD